MKIDNIEKKILFNKNIAKNINIQLNKLLSKSPQNKKKTNKIFTYSAEKDKKISIYNNYNSNDINSNKLKSSVTPRTNSPNSDYNKYLSKKINIQKQTQNKKYLKINDIIGEVAKKPIIKIFNNMQKNINLGKISNKQYGLIKAYAASTNKGIIRNYNEDRISIMINMNPPINCKNFPTISFFAIFDGHGGKQCAEYLRENLLKLICANKNFPSDIMESIKEAFKIADEDFLNNYAIKDGKLIDCSGSCGLFLLIIDNMAYVANVGDSRCLISCNNGKIKNQVTRDHKPNFLYEKQRIILNGGIIYQSQNVLNGDDYNASLKGKILIGPFRVLPGRLSVSRTIGDAEAKCTLFGGMPNVVINEPDIYSFNIDKDDVDYFILCCDGVFDQLNNDDIFECVSLVVNYNKFNNNNSNIHSVCGDIVNLILNASMERKSFDNVSCIIVTFKNLLNLDKMKKNSIKNKNLIVSNSTMNFIKTDLKVKTDLKDNNKENNIVNNRKEEILVFKNKNKKMKRKSLSKESKDKKKLSTSPSKYSTKNKTTIDYPTKVRKRIILYSKNNSNKNIFTSNLNKKITKKILNYSPKDSKKIELFNNNKFSNKKKRNINDNLLKYYTFTEKKPHSSCINNNIIINRIKVIKPININLINNTNNNNNYNKIKNFSKSKSKKLILKTENNISDKKNKNSLANIYIYNNNNNEKNRNNHLMKNNYLYHNQKKKKIGDKMFVSPRYLNRRFYKSPSAYSKKNKNIIDIKLASINLNFVNKQNNTLTNNSKTINDSSNSKNK